MSRPSRMCADAFRRTDVFGRRGTSSVSLASGVQFDQITSGRPITQSSLRLMGTDREGISPFDQRDGSTIETYCLADMIDALALDQPNAYERPTRERNRC